MGIDQKGNIQAVGLIVGLAFIGIIFIAYQKYNQPKQDMISQEQASVMPIASGCGDFPAELDLKIDKQHYDIVKGPKWSPDCKNIAWSKWVSGTGGPGMQPATLSKDEGVFLYNPSSKAYRTVYQPKKVGETPEFRAWQDSNTILFTYNNNNYSFDLNSGTLK